MDWIKRILHRHKFVYAYGGIEGEKKIFYGKVCSCGKNAGRFYNLENSDDCLDFIVNVLRDGNRDLLKNLEIKVDNLFSK